MLTIFNVDKHSEGTYSVRVVSSGGEETRVAKLTVADAPEIMGLSSLEDLRDSTRLPQLVKLPASENPVEMEQNIEKTQDMKQVQVSDNIDQISEYPLEIESNTSWIHSKASQKERQQAWNLPKIGITQASMDSSNPSQGCQADCSNNNTTHTSFQSQVTTDDAQTELVEGLTNWLEAGSVSNSEFRRGSGDSQATVQTEATVRSKLCIRLPKLCQKV